MPYFSSRERKAKHAHDKLAPTRLIVGSFAIVILIGTLLLMMPFSSRDGQFTSFPDALFTATSATCVTGLIVADTYLKWSPLGQSIILLLIQVGGLSFVTLVSFFNIAIGRKLGLRSMQLASESINSTELSDTKTIIKNVIKISLTFELVGALLLCISFIPRYGANGIMISIFLAVSAFCNAGFDILGREGAYASLTNYNGDLIVMITIMLLIVCGGLGFLVWNDLIAFRKRRKLLLHTKVVLIMTALLILAGAAVFLLLEWNNEKTLGALPPGQRVTASFFQSVTLRTAGFNSVDVASLNGMTKIFSIVLMFIGAAPGSTGGGIKVTTFAVLFMTVVSVIKDREETVMMGRKVDKSVVYKALTVLATGFLIVTACTCVLYFSHPADLGISEIDSAFESVSAFATVGISAGVTEHANLFSRMILVLTMFVGRVGPISLALSVSLKRSNRNLSRTQVIPEGKIMVG